MQAALRPWITAGLALAGAGAIAAIPMAASMHDTQAADLQLVNTTDPLTAWSDLFTDTGNNFSALGTQIPELLQGKVEIPDTLTPETLLSHGLLYPIHNLGQIVTDQIKLLQDDLTGTSPDPTAFFTDLLASPAVELNAVLNGVGLEDYNDGLRGLLNPIVIAPGEDSSLGTFSNLFAALHDGLGSVVPSGTEGLDGFDFGL